MGQKVHPEAMRVGYIHDWKSNWFNEREFADYLLEDIKIREHIEGKLGHAGLSDIRIRKDKNDITVDIHTARPGIVIGKSGTEVDALRRETCQALTGMAKGKRAAEGLTEDIDERLVRLRAAVDAEEAEAPVHDAQTAVAFALREVRRTLEALIAEVDG